MAVSPGGELPHPKVNCFGVCIGITICRIILLLAVLGFVAEKAFLWLRRAGAVLQLRTGFSWLWLQWWSAGCRTQLQYLQPLGSVVAAPWL